MSSGLKISRNRKGIKPISVIITAVLLLGILFTIWYITTGKLSTASKAIGCKPLGVGEGVCMSSASKCKSAGGTTFGILSCPKDKPVCCVGVGLKGEQKDIIVEKDNAGEGEGIQLSGATEFYCKCRVENGILVSSDSFEKLNVQSLSKGGTDFTALSQEYELQARGTQDIKYCRITAGGKASGGECDENKGPSLKFTFTGNHDITLIGYDKKGGTQVASAVVDVNVAGTS